MQTCQKIGISRQSYYKWLRHRKEIVSVDKELIRQIAHVRNACGHIGGRKLYHVLGGEVPMGRDRFFHWLRAQGLLVVRKRRYARTTDSRHGFRIAPNRIKDLQINRCNQVWVSDITYLRTARGFCYLALIMDLYSRKIVGFDVNDTLEMIGTQRALKMAHQTAKNTQGTIHHSDRGSQYASPQYTKLLVQKGMVNSMSKAADCYENAAAERLNGILKQDYRLGYTFESTKQAKKAVEQAIESYNKRRPHWALNFKTPDQIYQTSLN